MRRRHRLSGAPHGEELQRRFKLAYWQFALTATDANRFAIRLARRITGTPWNGFLFFGLLEKTK